ncbi:MAG TPA: helix-turn-helix domain-containing protein [Flavobacterium sp.]|nr:helix-turn-helix domain-containing protein [Flavobacterium sp.]
MELTVLDIQILDALCREIREVSGLVRGITAPHRTLQQSSKWLDQQEVCQLLGITKRTLQTYRSKGVLCATQINRKNFFKAVDVERLMKTKLPLKKQGV